MMKEKNKTIIIVIDLVTVRKEIRSRQIYNLNTMVWDPNNQRSRSINSNIVSNMCGVDRLYYFKTIYGYKISTFKTYNNALEITLILYYGYE